MKLSGMVVAVLMGLSLVGPLCAAQGAVDEIVREQTEIAQRLGIEIDGLSDQEIYRRLNEELRLLAERIEHLRISMELPQTPQSTLNPPAQTAPAPAADVDTALSNERLIMVGLASALVIITGGFLIYFLVLSPRRKRRPMLKALAIIEGDDRPQFEIAEGLLVQALTAGLKKDDISDARFALAYVRARSENFADALSVAEELCSTDKEDPNAQYLRLWLLARMEEDEKIEKIYTEKASLMEDLLDAKLIAGITFLRRARMFWAKHEVEQAIRYFELLQPLKVLKEEIPRQIDESLVIFGIAALFERDWGKAEQNFSKAKTVAEKEGRPTLSAEIGLLLCRWKQADHPDIDEDLSRIVEQLTTELEPAAVSIPPEGDEKWLCRNVLLWHCVSFLFTWLDLPAGSEIDQPRWQELKERLDKVRAKDPDMGDPDLLWGLLRYYFFFEHEDERNRATATLERACGSDINVPEVITLIDREKKLVEAHKQGLTRFLTLVKEWLKSSDVPQALRLELLEKLQAKQRFQELKDIDLAADEDFAPSVADIQFRVNSLSRRVSSIVKPRLRKKSDRDSALVDEIMGKLESVSEYLSETTRTLEKTEQKMMLITGEFLLAEEEKDQAVEAESTETADEDL